MGVFYEFYGDLGDGQLVMRGEEEASVRSGNGAGQGKYRRAEW
jgi:hypothetical protein